MLCHFNWSLISCPAKTSHLDNCDTNAPTPSTCTVGLTGASCVSSIGSAMHHPLHRRSQILPYQFNRTLLSWCTSASNALTSATTHDHQFNRCMHSTSTCLTRRGCHLDTSKIFSIRIFTMIWTSWQQIQHVEYSLDFLNGTWKNRTNLSSLICSIDYVISQSSKSQTMA